MLKELVLSNAKKMQVQPNHGAADETDNNHGWSRDDDDSSISSSSSSSGSFEGEGPRAAPTSSQKTKMKAPLPPPQQEQNAGATYATLYGKSSKEASKDEDSD